MTHFKKIIISKIGKIGLCLIVALLIALPWSLNPYILQIVIFTITYGMLGLAFAFTLKVGLIRFDVAGWWGIGAYASVLLVEKTGMSFWLTIPIAGLIAVILGWMIFAIAIPRGMLIFFVFGLTVTMIFQQVFGSMDFFGGWAGTPVMPPPSIGPFLFNNKVWLYYLGLAFLAVMLIVFYLLFNSKIGRAWNAIGSSQKLASSVGVDVVRYRMANVLIGNFFLAIVGSYTAAYSLVAVPATFGFYNSVYTMMYVVVGGLSHSLLGPLIGATIITFVPEYFRVAKEYEPIITSVAIILIIIFMPMGILGVYDSRIKPWLQRFGLFLPFKSTMKEELSDPLKD